MTRNFLLALLLLTPASQAWAQSLPPGVVDYLRSRKQDSSFKARKTLWKGWRSDGYKGTADQNTWLRNALVARDHAPRPLLKGTSYRPGEVVTLSVAGSLGVESELKQSCWKASGASVALGPAKAGLFGFRLHGKHASASGYVFLWPAGGGLRAQLLLNREVAWTATEQTERLARARKEKTSEVATGLRALPTAAKKFASGFSAAAFKASLARAFKRWAPENAGAMGESALVCTVAASAWALPGTQAVAPIATKACFQGLAGGAFDLFIATVTDMAQSLPGLTTQERKALSLAFQAAKLATDLASLKGNLAELGSSKELQKKLKAVEVALGALDKAADYTLEEGPFRATVKILLQAGKKTVVVLQLGKT